MSANTLLTAVENNDIGTVKYLASVGVNLNVDDDIALQLAVAKNNLEIVKFLTSGCPDKQPCANVNANNSYAIKMAANNGNLEMVKYLVSKKANIYVDDEYPLRVAEHNGHTDVVNFLQRIKSLIQAGMYEFDTAKINKYIHEAIKNNDLDLLEFLILLNNGICHRNSLGLAINDLNTLQYVYNNCTNINNDSKNDALIWASMDGNIPAIKFLLDHGTNINAGNGSPIQMAASKGHLDTVKYLAEHGAIIDLDINAAYVFAAKNGHLDVIKYLVTRGLNLRKNGAYAYGNALQNNHTNVIDYLDSQGIDIYTHE